MMYKCWMFTASGKCSGESRKMDGKMGCEKEVQDTRIAGGEVVAKVQHTSVDYALRRP